ncbi:MAG: HIT family protein [Leptospirales bacterium]|nr:HIT family protein [Leptospirales bacterium]
MPTLFQKIVEGQIPCHRVAEDERHLAFLDVKPLKRGHTLAIPKQPIDYIFDMPAEEFSALQLFARRVALAQRSAIACKRIGVAVVGLEVPHVHIHLIPLDQIDDTNFARPRLAFSEQQFAETAAEIRKHFV